MKKKNRPELLAPAGGMKELMAAVSSGADAVYLGGRLFNARMNAGNFDDDELRQAVRYAHLRGVKIYVTMNTLLFDDELEEALRYAAKLYEIGVDALIIQDLGLGHLIKKYIPDFELHLSTQGTVYNASGARTALSLGYERVVAAREMSLDEISEMTKICDTEVFVHGAICMCYSGQCQLSRSIGGRSGNRGECAQPCRLLYEDENGRKGYWLSPKDLCLIDRLGDLIEAGVCSFKIEGRMKSPEYVAVVTSIYRKYIDAYTEEGKYSASEEDRQALMQIFSRGQFTEGYIDGQPERFLSGDLPKHQGILIGHVLGRGHHDLVRVQLSASLEMGDGIEIRGGAPGERKPAGNVITYIEELPGENLPGKRNKKQNRSGSFPKQAMIGDIRGDVKPGDLVYRISSKRQLGSARKIAEGDLKKLPVRMSFFAMPGKKANLTVSSGDVSAQKIESDEMIQAAKNRPTDEAFVMDKLSKTGDTVYSPEKINIKLAGDCYIPASVINQMRRSALDILDEKRLEIDRASAVLPDKLDLDEIDCNEMGYDEINCNDLDSNKVPSINIDSDNTDSELMDGEHIEGKLMDGEHMDIKFIHGKLSYGEDMIRLPEITKGKTDELIRSQIENQNTANEYNDNKNGEEVYIATDSTYEDNTFYRRKVLVNNLGWIQELKRAGAIVLGGRGLNVTNRAAVAALADIGVTACEWSKELEEEPDRLMITEYDLPQKMLKDSRGRTMKIRKENGKTIIEKQ